MFPYQLVAFLDREPEIGEPIYGGSDGWYANIALKRRFRVEGVTEEELLGRLEQFAARHHPFDVRLGELTQPHHMPVRVIPVDKEAAIVNFHEDFFKQLGGVTASKYLEREQENFYPHVTMEWQGEFVLKPEAYAHHTFPIKNFWVVKDIDMSDTPESVASMRFGL